MTASPGLSRWPQCHHKGPKKTKTKGVLTTEGSGNGTTDARLAAAFEDGGRGPRAKECEACKSRSWRRQGNGSSLEPGREYGPANTMTSAQWKRFQTPTSRIQENKSVLLKATRSVVICYRHSVQRR